jgi:hypothetical protein
VQRGWFSWSATPSIVGHTRPGKPCRKSHSPGAVKTQLCPALRAMLGAKKIVDKPQTRHVCMNGGAFTCPCCDHLYSRRYWYTQRVMMTQNVNGNMVLCRAWICNGSCTSSLSLVFADVFTTSAASTSRSLQEHHYEGITPRAKSFS